MSGSWKLSPGMRNVRANGSPSGLNQTSANVSPLYFKAAHCFEGGRSEKFTTHLLPLWEPVASLPPRQRLDRSLPIVMPAQQGGKTECLGNLPGPLPFEPDALYLSDWPDCGPPSGWSDGTRPCVLPPGL